MDILFHFSYAGFVSVSESLCEPYTLAFIPSSGGDTSTNMFTILSPDVLLNVLRFLGLPEISSISVVCRDSHNFVINHESEIYHQVAVTCRFAPSGCSLKEVVLSEVESTWLHGVRTWKEFGQYEFLST